MSDLRNLCSISAISGFEYLGHNMLTEIFDEFSLAPQIDKYGNIYAEILTENAEINMLIDVHIDEIGLIVTNILENGFVEFDCVGGIDISNLLCQEVYILGMEKVYGVIGAIPPHLKKENDKLLIDTGFKNLQDKIKVGDPIKFKTNYNKLKNNQHSCNAMDNRASLLCALLVAEKFKQSVNLTILGSTREETGLQGSKLFLEHKNFDLAIVIDVTHGYFQSLKNYRSYPVGEGFTLCYGGILQNSVVKKMNEFLKNSDYHFNVEVEPSNPGTNAYSIVNYGIPTIMISIPLKYMHTTVETVSMKDIKKLAKFIREFDWRDALC